METGHKLSVAGPRFKLTTFQSVGEHWKIAMESLSNKIKYWLRAQQAAEMIIIREAPPVLNFMGKGCMGVAEDKYLC